MFGVSNSQNVGSHGGSLKGGQGHQYSLAPGLDRLSAGGSWHGWSRA